MSEISLETLALAKKYTDESGGGGGTGGDKVSQKTLNAAKEYADGKDAENLNVAKSYADDQDTTNLASAKSYADQKDATNLQSAKTYADQKDATNLSSAKTYADQKDATNLASAKSYADTQDAATLEAAKDYTDNATLNSYIVSEGTEGTITIGTGWSDTDPHTITVTAQDYTITSKTMVSILPHAGTIIKMREDGVQTMYITNNNGTLTAYAIGNKPTAEMTVPVLYTEVE